MIPIPLASRFVSETREGTCTPDENLTHRSNVDLTTLSPWIHISTSSNVISLNIIGSTENGVPMSDIVDGTYAHEDGLILSLSNRCDREIAERLGKEGCVEILNVSHLKNILYQQLGLESTMRACEYTDLHQRNHFLKSTEDAWQEEFRLFWPIVLNDAKVNLPAGIARRITFGRPLVSPREKTSSRLQSEEFRVAKEFTATDLNSIRALVMDYLMKERPRRVANNEMSSVVLEALKFDYAKSFSIFRQLADEGYIEIVNHEGVRYLKLLPAAAHWQSKVKVDIPEPSPVVLFLRNTSKY